MGLSPGQSINFIFFQFKNFCTILITNGVPSTYNSTFTWQAVNPGDYVIVINIAYDGIFLDYFDFYWYGASPPITLTNPE